MAKYSKEDFLVIIIFYVRKFSRANSIGFLILYLLRKVNIFFFLFLLFFVLIRNMYMEMLHVFERLESIHKKQTGFSLEYQNIHARYI